MHCHHLLNKQLDCEVLSPISLLTVSINYIRRAVLIWMVICWLRTHSLMSRPHLAHVRTEEKGSGVTSPNPWPCKVLKPCNFKCRNTNWSVSKNLFLLPYYSNKCHSAISLVAPRFWSYIAPGFEFVTWDHFSSCGLGGVW